MLLRSLLDTLAPHRCLACGARGALPWCGPCSAAASALRRPPGGCARCGGRSGPHPCWREPSPVGSTRVAFDYRGVVATSVVTAKVRGATAAWPHLGREVARAAVDLHPDVVTWIPADPARMRERGLDHARALAEPVAAGLGRPLVGLLHARPGRPDQATRPVGERRSVPLDAFRPTTRLTGAVVVLVDDVVTTGATAWAAAAALRRAGADAVALAVLARAGEHHLGPPDEAAGTGPPAPARC